MPFNSSSMAGGEAAAPVAGLRPPTSARGQDRRGVDHVALDPFGLQHPVDPKAVEAGLLNDDNRKVPPRPRSRFLLELSEPSEQASDIAGRNRMLRHLLPAAWR